MENKADSTTEPEVKTASEKSSPSLMQILKESTVDAWNLTTSEAEEVQGSDNSRQIVDGGLLGTCLVFFAAMLGVQQMDTPLIVASVAFALAIPPLAFGFLSTSFKITDKIKGIPGWRLLGAVLISGAIIEVFGGAAVLVGLCAVVLHISHPAFTAFIWAIIGTLLLVLVGTFLGLLVYAWMQYQQHQPQAKPAEPPAPPPTQHQVEEISAKPHATRKRQPKTISSSANTQQEP